MYIVDGMGYPGPGNVEGSLTYFTGNPDGAVRPVISLKSCVTWQSGDGTTNNPYTVSVNATCAALDN